MTFKKALLSGLAALAMAGCASQRQTTQQVNYQVEQPQIQAPAPIVPQQNSKPENYQQICEPQQQLNLEQKTEDTFKLSGFLTERIASTSILGVGANLWKGPTSETTAGISIGNKKASLTASIWDAYSFGEGKQCEQDFYLDGKYSVTDHLSVFGKIAYWSWKGTDDSLHQIPAGYLGACYDKDDYNLAFRTIFDLSKGGNFYFISFSKKIPIEGTDIVMVPGVKGAYGNGFLGNKGLLHVTPNIDFQLGKIGPFDVDFDLDYQFGFNGKQTLLYGGINFIKKF